MSLLFDVSSINLFLSSFFFSFAILLLSRCCFCRPLYPLPLAGLLACYRSSLF